MKRALLILLALGCGRTNLGSLYKKLADEEVASLQNICIEALVDNIFVKDKDGNYVLKEKEVVEEQGKETEEEEKQRRRVDFDKLKELLDMINNYSTAVKQNVLRTLYSEKNNILELLIRHNDKDLIKLFTEIDKKLDYDTIILNRDRILDLIDGKENYLTILAEREVGIKFITNFLATNTNRWFIILEQQLRVIYILSSDKISDEQSAELITFLHFRGCKDINYTISQQNISLQLSNMLLMINRFKSIQALINCGYEVEINYSDHMNTSGPIGQVMQHAFISSIYGYVIKEHEDDNKIHKAVQLSDALETIKDEIRRDKDEVAKLCIERNKKGLTPLDYVIALGKGDVLKLMLEKDVVKIDQHNCLYMTPIVFSTIMNQVDCMKVCLDKGATIEETITHEDITSHLKNMPLPFLAAMFDSVDSMVFALEQMEKDANIIVEEEDNSQKDRSILTLSCLYKSSECFNKLIEMGADINHESNPLFLALTNGFKEGIEKLIEKGANVNYNVGGFFESPIIKAISILDEQIFDLIMEKVEDVDASAEGVTPLREAIAVGSEYFVSKLLEKGADINFMPISKRQEITPLMAAVLIRRTDMIKLLLKNENIDLGITLSGRSEEEIADLSEHIVEQIRRDNKKYNLQNGQTALDIARANNYQAAIELIEAKMKEQEEARA